jgi:hypothetical protein
MVTAMMHMARAPTGFARMMAFALRRIVEREVFADADVQFAHGLLLLTCWDRCRNATRPRQSSYHQNLIISISVKGA